MVLLFEFITSPMNVPFLIVALYGTSPLYTLPLKMPFQMVPLLSTSSANVPPTIVAFALYSTMIQFTASRVPVLPMGSV